jgi:hypothetical protein
MPENLVNHVQKKSTAHMSVLPRQKRIKFQLAILSATIHSAGFTGAAAELFVIFHISRLIVLTTTGATLLTGTLLTASMLTATFVAAALASRCLLAKILAFLTGSTHVSLEIVILHSVIRHVSIPPNSR